MVEMLTTAVTGGIMSKETALEQNPLVNDPKEEKTRLDKEANSSTALDNLNNNPHP